MQRVLCRILAVLSGLFLALPPGWCCFVVTASCREPVRPQQVASPRPPGGCCRSPGTNAPKTPRPAPKPSCPVPCCQVEWQPTVRPDPQQPLPALAAPPASLVEPPTISLSDDTAFGPGPVASSAPLHVLHCVWLC